MRINLINYDNRNILFKNLRVLDRLNKNEKPKLLILPGSFEFIVYYAPLIIPRIFAIRTVDNCKAVYS